MVRSLFRSSAIGSAVQQTEHSGDPTAARARHFATLGQLLPGPHPKHLPAEDVRSKGLRLTAEPNIVHQKC